MPQTCTTLLLLLLLLLIRSSGYLVNQLFNAFQYNRIVCELNTLRNSLPISHRILLSQTRKDTDELFKGLNEVQDFIR